VLLRLVYMMAVRWLIVLFRMIGIFSGLIAFGPLGILAVVCFVAVYVFLLSFAWTALRAVRILPALDISTDSAVQISFH
jgi:hypothetical protein